MNVTNIKVISRPVFGKKSVVAAILLALSLPGAAIAGDIETQTTATVNSPLLQILIRKGILTREEAVQVQQEAAAQEHQKKEQMVSEIKEKAVPKALQGLKIEALGYIDYSAGETGAAGDTKSSYNRFTLTRGYLGVQKEINPWLGARVTTDITRDASDSWETRIKYLYAYFKPGNLGFFTDTTAELGQGHIPWLDFEEHVNPYRAQGTMAIERAGVLNSADLGVNLRGNFGGKLAKAKARTGNSHYVGRYGTWHVGVYNGGGYHASEKNGDKVLEGRLTLRPLPDTLPGLQLSYFGATGKGNVAADAPDYTVNLGMVSYEHPDFILTTQYFKTKGNSAGSLAYNNNQALEIAGYSFFGTYHLPTLDRKLSLFGRYDHGNDDDSSDVAGDATYNLYMAGLAYDVYKGNMVLLDYEWANYGRDSGGIGKVPVVGNNLGDDHRMQMVYQFQF